MLNYKQEGPYQHVMHKEELSDLFAITMGMWRNTIGNGTIKQKSRMCKHSWMTTVTRPTSQKNESRGVKGSTNPRTYKHPHPQVLLCAQPSPQSSIAHTKFSSIPVVAYLPLTKIRSIASVLQPPKPPPSRCCSTITNTYINPTPQPSTHLSLAQPQSHTPFTYFCINCSPGTHTQMWLVHFKQGPTSFWYISPHITASKANAPVHKKTQPPN